MAVVSSTPQPFPPGKALQDGSDINPVLANPKVSAQSGLTALGAAQATGLGLSSVINEVTVAAANAGVVLPGAKAGAIIYVFNAGTGQTIKVYPNGTDTIDGGAAGGSVNLSNNSRCGYYCKQPGQWLSAQLGAVSS